MGIQTKEIPLAVQRRAAELPCDGKKRYRVGKLTNLTYSEARRAILAESDLGPNDRGGRILTRGTANRLAELNRVYFRVAQKFVTEEVGKLAKKEADRIDNLNNAVNETKLPPDSPAIDDAVIPGEEIKLPEATRGVFVAKRPEVTMDVGAKLTIRDNKHGDVGTLSRNKGGYRCVIDGQEARSRSAEKIAELISTALEGYDWSLHPA